MIERVKGEKDEERESLKREIQLKSESNGGQE